MGEKHRNWLGEEYTETRMADGSIQRHYIRKDQFGKEYIEHTDEHGRILWKSYDQTDWWGDHYTEHYSPDNKYAGRSTKVTDFWGDEKVEYYDKNDKYFGESQKHQDWIGDEVVEFTPASYSKTYPNPVGGIVFYGILLILSVAICFFARQSAEVIGIARYIAKFCLAPVMLVIVMLCGHGEKTDSYQAKLLRGKAYVASSILFVGLQIFFLFYTDQNFDRTELQQFALFIGCWVVALIFSIYILGKRRKMQKRQKM